MAREMVVLRVQAGRLGQSLRDVSRGASRAGTARSGSRGRRSRRGSMAENKELPPLPGERSDLEPLNRASTWTHHLDLGDDDDHDEQNQDDSTNKLARIPHVPTSERPPPPTPPTPTKPKPAYPPVPSHPSPTPYLFSRPSFPSFHPLKNIDPTPSTQSDANFLAANTAASDAVSDSSIVAKLRRVRSAERVRAWRDGREEKKKKKEELGRRWRRWRRGD